MGDIVISGELLWLLWKLAIIPMAIFLFIGLICRHQEGGPAFGSKYWYPIMWILVVGWIGFWFVKGLFY